MIVILSLILAKIDTERALDRAMWTRAFADFAKCTGARCDDDCPVCNQRHRLRRTGSAGKLSGEWLLERAAPAGEWQPQYTFDLGEVAPADIEQANHWTSTAPGTRFTTLHVVTRPLSDGFASLVERTLTVSRGAKVETREIGDRPAYSKVLRDIFGLDLPEAELARLPLFVDEAGPSGQ